MSECPFCKAIYGQVIAPNDDLVQCGQCDGIYQDTGRIIEDAIERVSN